MIPELLTPSRVSAVDNPEETRMRDEYIAGFNACRDEVLQAMKPRPMHTAPRDGTVILAFIDGTNYAQPVRCANLRKRSPLGPGEKLWRMAWDDFPIPESDLLGWLPVPVYSGLPVR